MIRVGIIGLGKAGSSHIEGFRNVPNATVAAVCDLDRRLADRTAQITGAAPYYDYRDMHGVDAVVICLPHHLLAECALWSASRGLHILLEKPMAPDLATAKSIVDECESAGVKLMVGFVHRFRSEVMQARTWIRAGYIGRPVLAHDYKVYGARYYPDWVWQREAGGGAILYLAIHGVDRLRWLMDSNVELVSSYTGPLLQGGTAEDSIVVNLRFRNGAVGDMVEAANPATFGGEWWTELFGTRGRIFIRTGESAVIESDDLTMEYEVDRDDHFLLQSQAFASMVESGGAPPVSGQDGLAALGTCLSALTSAAEDGAPKVVPGPWT